jgi:Flp pilus assembly pilin Flp
MRGAIRRLLNETQGQDLIEYALLSALLAIACIGSILQLTQIVEFFEMVGTILQDAI